MNRNRINNVEMDGKKMSVIYVAMPLSVYYLRNSLNNWGIHIVHTSPIVVSSVTRSAAISAKEISILEIEGRAVAFPDRRSSCE